jgi:predicted TIM-barrel fold metal-dependent hydrolase
VEQLERLQGRIVDADSHEMIPSTRWAEAFGDIGARLRGMLSGRGKGREQGVNTLDVEIESDSVPINSATVWEHDGWVSGASAPAAIDVTRRAELLDFMGVARQQIFPNFGLIGLMFETMGPELVRTQNRLDPVEFSLDDIRQMGQDVVTAHNDWAVHNARSNPRLRIVGILPVTELNPMMSEAERLIDAGIRSFLVPASVPPGGYSPADRALDPFWSLCSQNDTTVHLHLALENFLKTEKWRDVPEFFYDTGLSAEFVVDPWTFSTVYMVAEIYLTTMILGGVFERHPALRFGAIESSAFWVAPMAENLDRWAGQFKRRMAKILSMPPSGYVARNVRATPFIFEPVDRYIERYGFEDVYCYGSDYPHYEGGTNQMQTFAGKLARLGDDVMEKFFVTNGEMIIPDLRVGAN